MCLLLEQNPFYRLRDQNAARGGRVIWQRRNEVFPHLQAGSRWSWGVWSCLWDFGQVLSGCLVLRGAKGRVFLVAEQGEEMLLSGVRTVSRLQIWLPSWFRSISSPVNGERCFRFEAILGGGSPPSRLHPYQLYLIHDEEYQGEKFNCLPQCPPFIRFAKQRITKHTLPEFWLWSVSVKLDITINALARIWPVVSMAIFK